ncbi:MAG: CHRD domain-containing protein [Terriglobales bacterium]
MKRTLVLATAILALVAAPLAASDKDKDKEQTVRTHLVGYNETPSTINSAASGEFKAKISDDGAAIQYELTFRDLSSSVLQSHIHFGRPAITGGIVLFLCTNLTPPVGPPTPQACPTTNPATITGTLTAADVIPLAATGQAIDSGAAGFAEMLKAIREGAAYVNVHTTNHPSGEIRGRLAAHADDDHH